MKQEERRTRGNLAGLEEPHLDAGGVKLEREDTAARAVEAGAEGGGRVVGEAAGARVGVGVYETDQHAVGTRHGSLLTAVGSGGLHDGDVRHCRYGRGRDAAARTGVDRIDVLVVKGDALHYVDLA